MARGSSDTRASPRSEATAGNRCVHRAPGVLLPRTACCSAMSTGAQAWVGRGAQGHVCPRMSLPAGVPPAPAVPSAFPGAINSPAGPALLHVFFLTRRGDPFGVSRSGATSLRAGVSGELSHQQWTFLPLPCLDCPLKAVPLAGFLGPSRAPGRRLGPPWGHSHQGALSHQAGQDLGSCPAAEVLVARPLLWGAHHPLPRLALDPGRMWRCPLVATAFQWAVVQAPAVTWGQEGAPGGPSHQGCEVSGHSLAPTVALPEAVPDGPFTGP